MKKNGFNESYDPTDDVFNRGLAVTMTLDDFITMIDNKGIDLSKHGSMYEFRTNDINVRGKTIITDVSNTLVQGINKNNVFVIKSKDIEEVRNVIFSKNVLSADFITEEGTVLTIWWEL